MPKVSRTVPAGEFKAKCLAIIDEVVDDGEDVVVTKRGKSVARVVRTSRYGTARRPAHFAHLYEYVGDIEAPLNPEWKAMK